MSILKFDNVGLIYHSLTSETLAIKNLDFEIKQGEFVAIVGPSGCGKTTILSLVSGILKPSTGRIVMDEGLKSGYMFQKDHLFNWRTIQKNITLGLELQNKNLQEDLEYIKALSDKYGIGEFLNRYPSQLSGGMRQRVALIRTLALKPDILLLDEPFSALDFQTRLDVCDDVWKIIKKEKKTAILVTHDIHEAISMADRVIILSQRPAVVKKIVDINLDKALTPFERREQKEFVEYFDIIWKELAYDKKQK